MARPRLDLDRRPILVFWETTRACLLSCAHCRASAIPEPLPGELGHEEARRFLEGLTAFGKPYPVLVLTGGDVLMRPDLLELVSAARTLGVPVAISPSVTPKLEPEVLHALREEGVKVASLSLDGASARTHDRLRGVPGHFEETARALRLLRSCGFTVQVNTVVTRDNVQELPEVLAISKEAGASIWEVFFLVRVGRGVELAAELTPEENEDVCHFLYDASRYGTIVRTVEALFFRRVVARRREGESAPETSLYGHLSRGLRTHLGEPTSEPRAQTKGTRDGRGIVFVAHDGDVYPAGFLPLAVGSVRARNLADVYRDSPLLRDIRAARFTGRCGICEYRELCGGSRARAFASFGDPLAEDPACAYRPAAAAANGLRAGKSLLAQSAT